MRKQAKKAVFVEVVTPNEYRIARWYRYTKFTLTYSDNEFYFSDTFSYSFNFDELSEKLYIARNLYISDCIREIRVKRQTKLVKKL